MNSMFDREARREKVLEGLAKEARIQATAVTRAGMKSVVSNVNIKSRLTTSGFDDIKKRAHGKTKKEELVERLVCKAEQNFYRSIKEVEDDRTSCGKPLHYTATEYQ